MTVAVFTERLAAQAVSSGWADGDVDALVARLFGDEATNLVRLARFFVDDRDAAEDLVQEAFIRLARSIDRVEDPARVPAYLRSIVLNLARDHNRRGLMSLRHRMRSTGPTSAAGPDEEWEVREDQRRVIEALRGLATGQRNCLVLRYYLDLSNPEIAETLGISVNTVKTQIQRGMAALGRTLGGGVVTVTALEQRLADALRAGGDATAPAPDLFARVQGSIEDDLRRRRRRGRAAAVGGLVLCALGSLAFGLSVVVDGRLVMAWWVLELITTIVLVGMALWLGPFIKRFGRAYAADVFRANPRTGKSFIVLTDIVYYLIFSAYILFTLRFEAEPGWRGLVTAGQLQTSVYRLAGILLIIGLLHGLNIVLMPVLGRLFSLNLRLDGGDRDDGAS